MGGLLPRDREMESSQIIRYGNGVHRLSVQEIATDKVVRQQVLYHPFYLGESAKH